MLSVITALEFFQHYFAKMGHRNTSCDPHLHQVIEQPILPTSREASAARAATSKRACVDQVQPKSSTKQFGGGKRRSQSFASIAFNDCTAGVIARVEQPPRPVQQLRSGVQRSKPFSSLRYAHVLRIDESVLEGGE